MSACALSDRRYVALLCSYTFSVLLLHRCVLFVFPLSLYHSQRTSTPRVCMSIFVGNRIDGISLFCIETHRSVLFVVTPSSCCPYNVQSERLLQVSACAFVGRASTRIPTVHSSKCCFHIVAVCLWSRRPCQVHRERLSHTFVCVCTSWAKLDENVDDIYFSSVFTHIVAYYRSVLFVVALSRVTFTANVYPSCLHVHLLGQATTTTTILLHVFLIADICPDRLSRQLVQPSPRSCYFLSRPYKPTTSRIAQLHTSSAGDDANHFIPYYLTTTTRPCTNFHRIPSSGSRFALRAETRAPW